VRLCTLAVMCGAVMIWTAAGVSTRGQESLAQNPSATQSPKQSASPTEAAPKKEETHPVDWAPRQYVELWNNDIGKDTAAGLTTIFNPVATMHSRGIIVPLSRGVLLNVIAAWRRSMPDLHFKIEDAIIEGNKVVLRLTYTGTYTKLLWPNAVEPDKFNPLHKVHSTEILIFEVKNGKISQIWEEYDEPLMRLPMGSSFCARPGWATAPPAPSAPPAGAPPKQ